MDHSIFIIGAYAVSFAVIAALTIRSWLVHRKYQKLLS